MRVLGCWMLLCLSGGACGGAPTPPAKTAPRTVVHQVTPVSAAQAPNAASEHKDLNVKGIEGTMHAHDVRDTMDRRVDALSACQQQRIRKVRHLAGTIELAIHVEADGSVGQVDVLDSDIGDSSTEACIAQVTRQTAFPAPYGGAADVKWNMTLEPLYRWQPEGYEEDDLAESLELRLPDLAEACEMTRRSPHMTITAYVAPNGKVITAGGATASKGQEELLACASAHVATWRLPRTGRMKKAQFTARFRPAINDNQRKAIREKHKRLRKAARIRAKAKARRARSKPKRGNRA